MKNKIGLIIVLFSLGMFLNIFTKREISDDKIEIPREIAETINDVDTSTIDFRTGKEWMPVPVVSCRKATDGDKNWLKTKYIITLENGVVIGSDKNVEAGSKKFCWMNMWYQTKGENMDSLIFEDPYIDENK